MRETLEAQPIAASTGDWHSQFRVSLKAAGSGVDLIRFVTRIKCGQAWYLSADRKLSLLEGEVSPPFPVGRFIVVETGDGLFKVSFLWGGSFRLRSERGAAEITIDVKDRAACGLSFWGDDKLRDPFGSRDFTISIDRLTALSECIWLEPYPEGARAAICLTDHADFDSIETMRLLVPAFIRNGIRFTKSVFPHSDPHPRKREPGLDVPEYAGLIDELYATGSEIAFHGLTPRVQAPGIEECARRTQMMARYAPQTWIDHGSGAYLFSRNGYLPNGRRLVDVLDRYGILNYWSYFDLWDNPSTHLCCWRPRRRCDVLHGFRHAAARSASLKQKTYFGLHELRNLLGEQAVNGIRKHPLRPSAWRKALVDHQRLLHLRRHPFVLYGPDASAFGSDASQRLIFDTVLLNHPGTQLGPEAVETLYHDSGLLLAHVYLSCRHDYALDAAVEYHRGTLRLGSKFEANLQHLGERQRRGEIVTLTVAALRNALLAHARAGVRRTERGWMLNSENEPACLAGDAEYVKRLVCCKSEKRIAGATGYLVVRSSEPVGLFESCSAAELELV